MSRLFVAFKGRRHPFCNPCHECHITVDVPVARFEHTPVTVTEKLCRPVKWKGKRERGLNPLSTEDNRLLRAISGGEFMINGFRNRDVRQILFGTRKTSESETKKQSGKVTQRFRLLRAHGLIRKESKTHRYMVTDKGRLAITALLAAQNANTKKLAEAA